MRKLVLLFVLPLILITGAAFGEADLQGCWYVEVKCLGSLPPTPNQFNIRIKNQSQGLFEVYNCTDSSADPCFGAIDKRNIYITCWDNIITGQIGKNAAEINFITQNQDPIGGQAGTCKGTAIRANDSDCNTVSCPE